MKKIIPLIILTVLLSQHDSHSGHNHNEHGPPKIASLSGKIINIKTDKPVPYATVSLSLMPEDEVVDGIMCDDDGYFNMTELSPGTYKVIIESIGYEKNIIENFSFNRQDGIKRDLGTIKLTPKTIDIDAVNVIEQRSLYEFETDKMVYNASDDIISGGGTAEDVLRKVPLVTVDIDGGVKLRGNSNVKILIDGRDSRFGSEVDNIPSSLIDQVEVITSPSAKYDPEGMAGIINIKLKKGNYTGLNGKIKLNGRYNDIAAFDKMNGFTTFLNYRHKKFNLYSSLNFKNRFNIREGFSNKDVHYYYNNPSDGESILESFHYSYINESIKPNKTFKIGGDYFISDKLILNSEISFGSHIHDTENTQYITKPSSYVKESGEKEDGKNYDIEGVIGIDKDFDNPDKELTFELSFDHALDKESEFTNNEKLSINDKTPITEIYNKMNIDLSYKFPVNEKSKIEFGYDGRFINSDENMELQITDTLGYRLEADINSLFKRYINAVYFEYENTINETFSIKPSFRAEYVIREINYEKLNEQVTDPNPDDGIEDPDLVLKLLLDERLGNKSRRVDKPDPEIAIYPDLHFTYNLPNKKSIQFGMSKRVERPGSHGHGGGKMQIRPFPRNLYAEGNVFIGNPFLKSSYTTIADISYKLPISMGFMMLNSHYSYIESPIKWDSETDWGTGKNVTTFLNADYAYEYGVDFFTMIMGQTIGGGITNTQSYHKNSNGYKDPDLNETLKHMNMFVGINFPEKYIKFFDFEFGLYWMYMETETERLFGEYGTIWGNIGIGKSFFNNRLSTSLKVSNLFNAGGFQMYGTDIPIYPSNGGTFPNGATSGMKDIDMSHSGRPQTISMNFTYSFGKMEDHKHKSRRGHDHGSDDTDGIDIGF